jgi:rRNA-processing protein FCF1
LARASSDRLRDVVLDSSFLMAVMESPTPWQDDITQAVGAHSFVVLQSVRAELERIAMEGTRRARFASLGLDVVLRLGVRVQPDKGGKPDDEMISFALVDRAAVATVDAELVARLRAVGLKTITLRGGRVSV